MSPGLPGTYAQLLSYARRALTHRARIVLARPLRAAAAAMCPCGSCGTTR